MEQIRLGINGLAGCSQPPYSVALRRASEPSNLFWAVGPQTVQYVFDGGYRRAQFTAAKAVREEAGERYRSVVLSAFQQVEDNLALLSYLGTALDEQKDAADAER
jgi:outer membrane protein TolC